ncbi:response regulator [Caldimonas tepidiphila]|uniref:response regulator n=1 Tax=Caldimonas tepidiphila TaxID=2315841 RepID=UPI000E5A5386|nr:response regulator [Caldimonas tepidiphila]
MEEALRRILCVEDDPDIRLVLQFSLGRVGGYELLMCPDGPSALAQAVAFAPQLVLLDVMMPGMSGPETLAALRGMPALRGVPMVFLTAKALLEEVEDILELGATGVIVKPFDPMRLPRDVKIYWEHGRGCASA